MKKYVVVTHIYHDGSKTVIASPFDVPEYYEKPETDQHTDLFDRHVEVFDSYEDAEAYYKYHLNMPGFVDIVEDTIRRTAPAVVI